MKDKETTQKILEALDRFDSVYTGTKPEGYRMSMFIIIGKAVEQGLVDMGRLLAFPDHDFLHDMTSLYGSYNSVLGVFSDDFLPRSVR